MADFPLQPQLSKMLIASVSLVIISMPQSILSVVMISMLQNDQIWYRPREKQAVADQRRAHYFEPNGDHLLLLVHPVALAQARARRAQGDLADLLGLLCARGQEGPAGRIQDAGGGTPTTSPLVGALRPPARLDHLTRCSLFTFCVAWRRWRRSACRTASMYVRWSFLLAQRINGIFTLARSPGACVV